MWDAVSACRRPRLRQGHWSPSNRNKDAKSGVLDSMSNSKLPADPEPSTKSWKALWPLGWMILEGIATVGWLCAIAWAGVRFAQWLFG
jgi:hypothetical protein